MNDTQVILEKIKKSVAVTAPGAKIILYGSYARGDYHTESDIDVLILVDQETIDHEDEKKIAYPLYDIEFESGRVISPLIRTKTDWNGKYTITPLFENITKEGIEL